MIQVSDLLEGPGTLGRCLRQARKTFLECTDRAAESWTLLGACDAAINHDVATLRGSNYPGILSSLVSGLCEYGRHLPIRMDGSDGGRPFADVIRENCVAAMRFILLQEENVRTTDLHRH